MAPVQLEDLDYELDEAFIAQVPIEPRDAARLLVDRGETRVAEHRFVRDLPQLLYAGDLVVVNHTKVIPARLVLTRSSGGAAEVLLLEPLDPDRRRWEALVRPARKLRPGDALFGSDGAPVVRVGSRTSAGDTFEVTLVGDDEPLDLVEAHGRMPLPPYIHTPLADDGRYQTVFAHEPASAAAPTAGLHLTREVFDEFTRRGIDVAEVELVVGLDTFAPVTEQDPLTHPMHSERYRVPEATWSAVQAARHEGRRVVAIGTTTVRALESVAATGERSGRTTLFLHQGRRPCVVDVLMTNFHMPRTTLLMMIEAFIGTRWRVLYAEALSNGYRFLSFGDAMLITSGRSDS